MSVGAVYVALFVLGVVWALLTGLLGWLGDASGGGDVHVDASGHLDAGHVHPLSGTIVATFITGFGGGGILAEYVFAWSRGVGLGFALACGLTLGAAAFAVLDLLFRHTEAGSEYDLQEAAGLDGEVITAIPVGGTGEVSYETRGERQVAPARASEGGAIAKGRPVRIVRVAGNTLHVKQRD